jgi:hypothetical protein
MSVWLDPERTLVAVVVFALGVAYGVSLAAPAAGIFHDDGIYLVTAKALATGHGYRILSLPEPIAQTKYPPLFPVLLATVWKLRPQFPSNVIWLKMVPLVAAMAWWAVWTVWLREKTGDARVAAILILLVMASPWVLFLSTALLSETLFAALAVAALRAIERASGRRSTILVAAALASAALLTRIAGVAVIGACAISLWQRSGIRKAAVFLVVCATLSAPWLAWQQAQRAPLRAADSYYTRDNYQRWNVAGSFAWREKAAIAGVNLLTIIVGPGALMGLPATRWGDALALAVGLLAGFGLVGQVRQGWGALEWFVVLDLGLIVMWAWPPTRFVAPLLPALLLYLYLGTAGLCRHIALPARCTQGVLLALAAALAVPAGVGLDRNRKASRVGRALDPW